MEDEDCKRLPLLLLLAQELIGFESNNANDNIRGDNFITAFLRYSVHCDMVFSMNCCIDDMIAVPRAL